MENEIAWHQRDWLQLQEAFPQHEMVTAGDYNQARGGVGKYGNQEVRQLLSDALMAANLQCVTEENLVATQNLSRHSVDHICLSSRLAQAVSRVTGWEGTLNGMRLSDHNGVTVDLNEQLLKS